MCIRDSLFAQGATPDALDGVVRALLANRYVQSAKHQFQLLKVLIVGDQPFVFNVDLLQDVYKRQPCSSQRYRR